MTRRRVAWVVAIVAVLIVAGWLTAPLSDAPFREYVDRLRAAGEPLTVAELIDANPSDDAAQVVFEAIENRKLISSTGVTGPWDESAEEPWFETADPVRLRELSEQLARLDAYFGALAEASRLGHLGRGPTVATSLDVNDDAVPALRAAVQLLSARAIAGREPAQRLEALETLLRLSRLARGTSFRRMLGTAIATQAAVGIRHELSSSAADAAAMRKAVDPLLSVPRLPALAEVARSERVVFVEVCTRILDGELTLRSDDPDHVLMLARYRYGAIGRRVMGLFCNGGTPVGSPADCAHAGEFLDGLAELSVAESASYPRLHRLMRERCEAVSRYSVAYRQTIVCPRVASGLAKCDAVTGLARIALAAAEHRATHGDFPASLDDLKPMFADGVPLDPFTDAPFVYEKTATGVRIASQGRLADEAPLDDATLREKCLLWELKR